MSVPVTRRRVAIVAGVRTPFARSGTVLRDVPGLAMARHAARELLYRTELDGALVDEVIAANSTQVEQFRAGKQQVLGFLVGQVMKASKGKANPQQVNDALRKKLG